MSPRRGKVKLLGRGLSGCSQADSPGVGGRSEAALDKGSGLCLSLLPPPLPIPSRAQWPPELWIHPSACPVLLSHGRTEGSSSAMTSQPQ